MKNKTQIVKTKAVEPQGKHDKLKLIIGIIVTLFVGLALYLRVALPYDQVFTQGWVKFTSNDAYYYMRIVDNLVHNFPRHTAIDPYLTYPAASGQVLPTFFAWLLAAAIWVIGLGSPSHNIVDIIGAWFPAVLGALTVIPVYFIGKALLSRWAGLLAAGLIAILPGEFLGRSILGFTDHHVAETLLTAITMLFLILAIITAGEKKLSFDQIIRRNWRMMSKPLIYSLLAGFFLGTYFLTWPGAPLFIFIITVYLVIQFIIDHLRGRSTDYLCMVGTTFFFVALVMSLFNPILRGVFYLSILIAALVIPLVLSGVSRLMIANKLKAIYYPLSVIGLGLVGAGVIYLISPSIIRGALDAFSVFTPQGAQLTTIEMQPILFPTGSFTLAIVWGNFSTTFFFGLIGLGYLVYLVIKYGDSEKTLFVVWSLVMLAATLGQRRFAYYLVVNAALLSGYLIWRIFELTVIKQSATVIPKTATVAARKVKRGFSITLSHINIGLAVLIIFLIVFFPNIPGTIVTASQARYAPSDAWQSSMLWLKDNTPEPFGNPDAYYEIQKLPPPGQSYQYPASAYSVMAWWDYGYWITRIAHRIPYANPGQDPIQNTITGRYFTSQNETSVQEIIKTTGSKYVVIDFETAISKFWAMAIWAGGRQSDFFDVYYLPQEGGVRGVPLFHTAYYQSLSTRLYNFDAKAVTPQITRAITYEERAPQGGSAIKVITDVKQFNSYPEARAFLESPAGTKYKVIGTDPFTSPIPLEALENYKVVYGSEDVVPVSENRTVSQVKIFEYIGP